jgi:hypothetical protein
MVFRESVIMLRKLQAMGQGEQWVRLKHQGNIVSRYTARKIGVVT